jgi:hypothetical protein
VVSRVRGKPARQPEAVAAGFESQRNPRNIATDFDRLIPPAMQQGKQPFWAGLQLLARLTLNARKHFCLCLLWGDVADGGGIRARL